MKQLRKTKIVGTIGPASENKLEELFNSWLTTSYLVQLKCDKYEEKDSNNNFNSNTTSTYINPS